MTWRDNNDSARRPWWRWPRNARTDDDARTGSIRSGDDSDAYGAVVGQTSTGSGGGFVPILLGFAALVLVVGFQLGAFRWIGEHTHIEFVGSGDALVVTQTMDEVMNAINARARPKDDGQPQPIDQPSRPAETATTAIA